MNDQKRAAAWPPAAQQTTVQPLRVAFVITGLGTGGAERMLEKLLAALSPNVVPAVFSLGSLGDIGPRLVAKGVPVHALGMLRGVPSPLSVWRLAKQLRAFAPDVVKTGLYHADLIGGLAARLAGVRAVMWGIHQSNIDPGMNKRSTLWVMRLCARWSCWLPQRILCVAERARAVHVAAGYDASRMLVIPNGFDTRQFVPDASARQAVRTELGLAPGTPLVAVVGRFDVQKNHRGFCDAMARLCQLRPGTHALLVGAQVDTNNRELLGWLQHAGVASVCHLLGPRTDIPRLMAALDVLLLPSLGEAFPNVVGEAMACGVPCAVTDVGDAAFIVGNLGRVVPQGDMLALADAAAELLALPPAARDTLARLVREDVCQRFDIRAVAQQHEQAYRALAAAAAA